MFVRLGNRARNLIKLTPGTFSVYAGKSATIPVANILAEDTDLGGYLPLIAVKFDSVVGGTVTVSGGNVVFTSTGAAGEPASFRYTVRNRKGQTRAATVTMTVLMPPALLTTPDTFSVVQGDQVLITTASLIGNDTTSSPPITFVSAQNPVGGTLTQNGANLTFQSTGRSGEPAQFEYTCSDNFGNVATGYVYITVQQLPEIDAFIYNDDRISNRLVTAPPLNQEIFNNWYRFSHGSNSGSGPNNGYPSVSSELTSWSYDSATDTIRSTINSVSYIGFIAPQKLSYYSLDVRMSSTDTDDDMISVVLAFWKDASNNEYTISACRSIQPSNLTPHRYWRLVYNACQPATETVLVDGNTWAGGQSTGANGWQNYTTGTVVRVERNGSLVKCYASRFGSDTLDPTSLLSFDLSSLPLTAGIANEPLQYGYGAMSQSAASFKVLTTKGALDYSTVYDIRPGDNNVYQWVQGTGWVPTGQTIQQVLDYPRVVHNPETGQRFQITATSIYEILS